MAKTAKEIAVKGRQTKLGKKSAEELITIVLRKDEVERKLNAQISNFKGEINSLNACISACKKDMDGTLKELKNLKDTNRVCRETIDSLRIQLTDKEEEANRDKKYIVELEENNQSLKTWATISTVAAIIAVVFLIF